jgi:uncharacterized repeat protein (TIGR03803 family)
MCFGIALGALVVLSLVGSAHTVRAQNQPPEKVLYNFATATGQYPTGVIRDGAGNLYVATNAGGTNQSCPNGGCGSILKFNSSVKPTVLYNFMGSFDPGDNPSPSVLTRDSEGNLYGTTTYGGPPHFFGTVFKLTPSGNEETLHTFEAGEDGYYPVSGVTIDSAGNLYGTTSYGGGVNCGETGCGVIYKVTPSGSETILYSFTGGTDGAFPDARPILDAAGNLYGTATSGGDLDCTLLSGGCGTVWKLDTFGNLSVLYSFTGGTDGAFPEAGLVMDSSGNLYGDNFYGGNLSCGADFGCGVVFEVAFSGNFTVLHAFAGGSNDGQYPVAALLRDSNGNLYGTTVEAGDLSCSLNDGYGCGVVFKLDSSGNETILPAFTAGTTDGESPKSALISGSKGNLYGTTVS